MIDVEKDWLSASPGTANPDSPTDVVEQLIGLALDNPPHIPEQLEAKSQEEQQYRYLVIIDIEGGANDRPGEDEIIELPCIVIDRETRTEEIRFHRFTRPVGWDSYLKDQPNSRKNPDSNAVSFKQALGELQQVLEAAGMLSQSLCVTCGDWDLKTIVPKQCAKSRIQVPLVMNQWCNLKDEFNAFYGCKVSGMKGMLSRLKMPLKGNHHLGMHDVSNIASILLRMLKDGATIGPTAERDEDGGMHFKYKASETAGKRRD
eukprot:CAMPEP_0173453650 /NCGR_PEP_ID=MMETSP1357-20121228/50992_1 /TAXON_ID=77926 /ORGANISM="Hemiselmis rufescens, Strain PCC563" /LENGTH=259 /DNA_ID=CAMNT_0014420619 /DNA_START=36 /DNA_END=815 /DNA_ORIENTATION=-